MEYTLRFIIKKQKANKQGLCPIHLRYTINRQHLYIPVNQSIHSTLWDKEKGVLKVKNKDVDKAMNDTMHNIKNLIFNFHDKWNANPSIEELKQLLNITKATETNNQITIEQAFHDFMEDKKHTSKATKVVLNAMFTGLTESFKHNNRPLRWSSIDERFEMNLKNYLIYKGYSKNTFGKYVKHTKSFLKFCEKHFNTVSAKYFEDIKIEWEQPDIISLSSEEYEILKHHVLFSLHINKKDVDKVELNEREKLIARIFLFLCSTGLRFSDFETLTVKSFGYEKEVDGTPKLYFKVVPIKTQRGFVTVPLMNEAMGILFIQCKIPSMLGFYYPLDNTKNIHTFKHFLDTYESNNAIGTFPDFPRLFPKISNQDFNDEIKKVCEKMKINTLTPVKTTSGNKVVVKSYPKYELISSHIGRKTFVTLSLERGISAEMIQAVTGHNDHRAMRPYINLTSKAVVNEFSRKIAEKDKELFEKQKTR